MNPWKTINIEPTDDKKLIKKAYAVLIKQYKPDEHPEKFKEVQEAYRYALQVLKWDDQERKNKNKPEQGIETPPEVKNINHYNEIDEQDVIADSILKSVDNIVKEKYLYLNKVENWSFVEKYNQLDLFQLKQSISESIFQKIAEVNLDFQRTNNRYLLDDKMLKYLNEVFDWEQQLTRFKHVFLDEQINAVSSYDDKNVVHIRPIKLMKRAGALLSDVALLFLIARGLLKIFPIEDESAIIIFFIVFTLIRLFSELFYKKATIGEIADDALTVNEYGNCCDKKTIIIRHIIASITLLPIFYLSYSDFEFINFYFVFFVTLIIGVHSFYYLKYKLLFHDYITNSMVIWKVVYHKQEK